MVAMKCGMCGAQFDCMGRDLKLCWCAKVDTSREKLAKIRKRTRDCVCKECLMK